MTAGPNSTFTVGTSGTPEPTAGDATYRGYEIDAGQLQALPAGSHLDPATGAFAWAPGVAFGGTHHFVFVRVGAGGETQLRVDVAIGASAAQTGDPQLVIDLPTVGATVAGPFTIAGWALDPRGPLDGAGIDAIHVWAYPSTRSARSGQVPDSGDPIFIGAATYGGARPDVAAVYGDRFLNMGYGITVQGLAPGIYDLVVYAHSAATRDFTIAKTVRVIVR